MYTLKQLHGMDCDQQQNNLLRKERRSGFRVIAVAVIGHLRPSFYNHSVPPSLSACTGAFSHHLLYCCYKTALIASVFFSILDEFIRCSAALSVGYMLPVNL